MRGRLGKALLLLGRGRPLKKEAVPSCDKAALRELMADCYEMMIEDLDDRVSRAVELQVALRMDTRHTVFLAQKTWCCAGMEQLGAEVFHLPTPSASLHDPNGGPVCLTWKGHTVKWYAFCGTTLV